MRRIHSRVWPQERENLTLERLVLVYKGRRLVDGMRIADAEFEEGDGLSTQDFRMCCVDFRADLRPLYVHLLAAILCVMMGAPTDVPPPPEGS